MIAARSRPVGLLATIAVLAAWVNPAHGFDPRKYMAPNELRRGMKGFGRTVLKGVEITRFEVEVLGVMRNVYYARQDVILIRCSGAGLEHSGIISGMSGSPVYITDGEGENPRMIGAVAFGWTFNKDPICGVQPITQMLGIEGVSTTQPATTRSGAASVLRWREWLRVPGDECRFAAVFGPGPQPLAAAETPADPGGLGLRPLVAPIMVSGASPQTMSFLRDRLKDSGFEPVPSGGFGGGEEFGEVRLEPGSVLCVPLMRGDIHMDALGTCTEVIGDQVLGFGHAFFADGAVEMPMATGAVHTVIPSVLTSRKIGAAIETVGTLVRDENTGIFGRTGPTPRMIPCHVRVREPGRECEYRYECLQHQFFTPMLFGAAVYESLMAHQGLPLEHTLRYTIETAFEDLGTFRSSNIASQSGASAVAGDAMMPVAALLDNDFGKARVERMSVEIAVEPKAHAATIERAELARNRVKPGETLDVQVQWRPFRESLVTQSYTLKVPDDLPEGTYTLTVCSSRGHVMALQNEKPYLFRAESMKDMLDAMNFVARFRDDRVFLRLSLPTGGLSVGRDALPEMPSFRRRILADSKRTDVGQYTDALVVEYPAPFTVSGARSFTVQVDRKADQ